MADNSTFTEPVTATPIDACRYCGTYHPHTTICPGAKVVEFYPDGSVKWIEFADGSWSAPLPKPPDATSAKTVSSWDDSWYVKNMTLPWLL